MTAKLNHKRMVSILAAFLLVGCESPVDAAFDKTDDVLEAVSIARAYIPEEYVSVLYRNRDTGEQLRIQTGRKGSLTYRGFTGDTIFLLLDPDPERAVSRAEAYFNSPPPRVTRCGLPAFITGNTCHGLRESHRRQVGPR